MKKVITYGTFDLFHQGHYNILKRAKEQGDYLIVGVTGESYDLERGKLNVRDSLVERIRNVRETGFADEVIVEEYQGQKIDDILKYDIDVFVVGSDWRGKFDHLSTYCQVVYLERTKDISSTQIRESSEQIYRIGIMSDTFDEDDISKESLYVSGLHVNGVCCEYPDVLNQFKNAFEFGLFTDSYNELLQGCDIVYIRTGLDSRAGRVKQAVEAGKHVIVESPFTLDRSEAEEVFRLAREHHVIVTERITLAYLRAFTQLVWLLHGGIIGDVVSLRITECDPRNKSRGRDDLLKKRVIALFAAYKLLNSESLDNLSSVLIEKSNGYCDFTSFVANSTHVSIEIASGIEFSEGLKIYGTGGTIAVPDDWWNIGYFEVSQKGADDQKKRYSFNFEGNGFRYLLQDLAICINSIETSGRAAETTKYRAADTYHIIDALSTIQNQGGLL